MSVRCYVIWIWFYLKVLEAGIHFDKEVLIPPKELHLSVGKLSGEEQLYRG